MSSEEDKTKKRRRSSISRGRRSLTAANAGGDDDEIETRGSSDDTSSRIAAFEKYKEQLDNESSEWRRLLDVAEQNLDTNKRLLNVPISRGNCKLSLPDQNFLDGRFDYSKYNTKIDRFMAVISARMSHAAERADLLSNILSVSEKTHRRKIEEQALRILENQRPVVDILSDLMALYV